MIAVLWAPVAGATNVIVPAQQPTVAAALGTLIGPGPHTIHLTDAAVYDEAVALATVGDVTIQGAGVGVTFLRVTEPNADAALSVANGRLTLSNLTLTGSTAAPAEVASGLCIPPADQRGVWVSGAALTLRDVELSCFASTGDGGAVWAGFAEVGTEGAVFRDNSSQGLGGHLHLQGGCTADLVGSTWEGGTSLWAGGAVSAADGTLAISGSRFANHRAPEGGALHLGPTAIADVYTSDFTGNAALDPLLRRGRGGAIWSEAESLDLWGSTFCANEADTGGAVGALGPSVVVQNNVFSSNRATLAGGGLALLAGDAGAPLVDHNTFTGNRSGVDADGQLVALGGGGAVLFDGVLATFRNNLLAYQQDGGGLAAFEGAGFVAGDPVELAYNAWFENCERAGCDPMAPLHLSGAFAALALHASNVVDDDPMLAYPGVGDQDCLADAPWPLWGSPLIDRGDPAPQHDDVDGSRSDIGHTGGPAALVVDRDGDGFHGYLDCDDTDPLVNPGAFEACNVADDDCDGQVDEGFALLWYLDDDGDGFGDGGWPPTLGCSPPPGTVSNDHDCDDGDPLRHPGAMEFCDGEDDDCDGVVDDEDVLPYVAYYLDADGDGYGIGFTVLVLCADPGFGYTTTPGDCDDGETSVFPGHEEVCDGRDNDCDAVADDDPVDGARGYRDDDGDGFGAGPLWASCDLDLDLAPTDGDCDDTTADTSPAAPERCDGADNDCDGAVDEGATDAPAWYQDADGDGLVNPATEELACDAPPGKVAIDPGLDQPFDCDDLDPEVGSCGGCGCDSAPSGGGALGLVALVPLLLRARRRIRRIPGPRP